MSSLMTEAVCASSRPMYVAPEEPAQAWLSGRRRRRGIKRSRGGGGQQEGGDERSRLGGRREGGKTGRMRGTSVKGGADDGREGGRRRSRLGVRCGRWCRRLALGGSFGRASLDGSLGARTCNAKKISFNNWNLSKYVQHPSSRLHSSLRSACGAASTGRHSAGVVAVIWYSHFSSSVTVNNAFSVPQESTSCEWNH